MIFTRNRSSENGEFSNNITLQQFAYGPYNAVCTVNVHRVVLWYYSIIYYILYYSIGDLVGCRQMTHF